MPGALEAWGTDSVSCPGRVEIVKGAARPAFYLRAREMKSTQ